MGTQLVSIRSLLLTFIVSFLHNDNVSNTCDGFKATLNFTVHSQYHERMDKYCRNDRLLNHGSTFFAESWPQQLLRAFPVLLATN